MRNALVVNAIYNKYSLKTKIQGHLIIDEVLKKASRIVDRNNIYILCDKDSHTYFKESKNKYKLIESKDGIARNIFLSLHSKLKDYKNIIYFFADEPLIDLELTEKLILTHNKEFADYSYGEGFIKGVLPEVISVEVLSKIASLDNGEGSTISRDTVFNFLSKDINSFDIETIFADKDLRLLRFELTTSEKKNRIIVEKLVSEKGRFEISYMDICKFIEKNPEIIRTIPSYVEVELTDRIHHTVPYMPIKHINRKRGEIDFENYKALLNLLVKFTGPIYLSLSYLGEPLLYPGIRDVIEEAAKLKDVSLIIETDGIDFTPDFSNFISEINSENLTIIFQLDAVKDETYSRIHNGEIKYVERNIRYLLSKLKKNVYVQMVRMDINEGEMLDFYNIWEGEGAGVIIQKYNDYLGILPKLSSAELRPLEKICCYHLMRDMVVFYNGDVPRCKQDIDGKYLLGNIFDESIRDIWDRGKSHFINHCFEKYDEDCKICDEYYIFNF